MGDNLWGLAKSLPREGLGGGDKALGWANRLTKECRRRCILDEHLYVLPDTIALLVEDYDLVLLGTAKELLTTTLAEALDEDLDDLTHIPLVALERKLVL